MINPRVIAKGQFDPDDIEVSNSDTSNLEISPEMAGRIDELWDAMLHKAEAQGKRIWNGTTARVDDLEVISDRKLKITFAPLDFKTRECMRQLPGFWEWPEHRWRKGGVVMAFVRTSDNYYVFVALSGKSLNERAYEMLGGVVGDTFVIRSGHDLYEVIYQEVEEQAAIQREHITSCILRLVFYTPGTHWILFSY
jgi:hypothetical protein